MIEAVGRVVSIETETLTAIWILPRRSSRLYKGKCIKMETKMDKNGQRVACKNWNVYSPQRQNKSYLFLAPLQWPWQGCCWNLPGSAMQRDTLVFLPHPTDITDITDIAPPPRPFASVRFDPLARSSGSDQRRISGCGTR